jgi:signal transduction histidine kinase
VTQTVPGKAGSQEAAPARGGAGVLDADGQPPSRLGDLLTRVAAWYAALSPRLREMTQDAALAVALAGLNLLTLLPYESKMHPLWLALLLVAGQCLPLALRRLFPVPVLIACGLIRTSYDFIGFSYAPLPLAVGSAFATVAERSGPVLRWGSVIGTLGGIAFGQASPGHNEPYDAIVQYYIFGAAWGIGTLSRHRRAALAAAASRAARAEAAVDAAAAQAAVAERLRIARELHDVVAHHVSLMAVQAEAVGALLPARPEAAAASADLIGSTARTAMTELRRLLGVLRFKQDPESERERLAPVPSMSGLDQLAEAARGSGLSVTCEVSGPVTALPPGVDLAAYRIVQEALTNAVRHAPGSAAAVRVGYARDELTVEVSNSGRAAGALPPRAAAWSGAVGPGYGLAGIAERVASCGGSLSLGPGGDGGFTVTARLPLG